MKNIWILWVSVVLLAGDAYGHEEDRATAKKQEISERLKMLEHSDLEAEQQLKEARLLQRQRKLNAGVQGEIAEFKRVEASMKARKENLKSPSATLTKVDRESTRFESLYMKGDRYIVSVYYYNDANYPRKYFDKDAFEKNDSRIFFSQTRTQIFTELLGERFEAFEPQLGVVSDESVGIKLLISNASELERILTNPLVQDSWHIGRPVHVETTR